MSMNSLVHRFMHGVAFALAFACLLIAAAVSPAGAQTTTGSLRGIVRDQGGAGLGDVTVSARDSATGFERATLTRETGFYNLAALPPGRYTVTVRRLGYALVARPLQVGIGQSLTLDFTLSTVSTTLSAVTVTAAPDVAETRTSEVATNVSQEQIQNLPSADRNFLDLAALAPGVTLTGTKMDDTRRTFKAGAQGAEQINVFIDGASYKNDILKGGVAGQDASRGNPFPRNAVQEFRVITQNYKAEYQKASSAIITAATKSGTNQWMGNAFYSFQNKSLVSLNAIQRVDAVKVPGFKKPEYSRNLFGVSYGGPIIRDRLHFFGSYEGNYQTRTNRVNFIKPTTGGPGPTGNFPALDTIDFASRNGEFDSPFKSTLLFGKLSFMHTSHSQFELSLNTRNENDIRDFGNDVAYEAATKFKNAVSTGILKHRFDVGSLLNEAMLSYQNYNYNPVPNTPSAIQRQYGFSTICCPKIGSNVTSQDFKQGRTSFRDDITWSGFQTGGQHIIKTGLNIDFLNYDIIKRNSEIPKFFYEPWFRNYEIPEHVEFQLGDPNFKTSNRQMGLYLQDDWTPTAQLTVNLGLRWDYESGMLNYDYVTPQKVVDSLTKYDDLLIGVPLDPKRYFTDGNDRKPWKGAVQPRLGFSYSIDKAARTTVFGGWGIFIDRTLFDQAIEEKFALQHPSYRIAFRKPGETDAGRIDFNPAYLAGVDALKPLVASSNAPEVKLLPNDLRPPKSTQMSLGVRQAVGTWAVDATYTNVHSSDVFTFYWANGNFVCPDRSFAVGGCYQQPGIPGFGTILLADNAGETWYNALQLKVDRPFRRSDAELDWGIGAGYTYAKRETKGFNDDFSFPNPVDYPRQTRNDETGRMVANFIMESARAWDLQFSGVLTIGSGERLDVGDRFGCPTAAANARDPVTGLPAPRCGQANPLISRGYSSPSFTNVDLRLRKDIGLGLRTLGVTLELFNAFNTQNFGCFNVGNPNDGNFGRPSCVINDAQRVQFGLDANF